MKIFEKSIQTPVGILRLLASEMGLCAVIFEKHKGGADEHHPNAVKDPDNVFLKLAAQELNEYFTGHRLRFTVPLDLSIGTEFQRRVWDSLLKIPYGTTISYREQAISLDMPLGVRAVAAANGRNPVSILVPCHRVISSQGNLHGYAGGLEVKKHLLELEGLKINGSNLVRSMPKSSAVQQALSM